MIRRCLIGMNRYRKRNKKKHEKRRNCQWCGFSVFKMVHILNYYSGRLRFGNIQEIAMRESTEAGEKW